MPASKMFYFFSVLCFSLAACTFFEKKTIEDNSTSPSLKSKAEIEKEEKDKIFTDRLDEVSSRINVLEQQIKEVKSINLYLNHNNDTLEVELNKKKAIILLQENVIKLLDDPEKTIEKSLKDEINAKVKEIEDSQKHTKFIFYVQDLFNSKTVEISPKGKELLLSLVDLIKNNKQQTIVVEGHTDDIPVSWSTQKKYPSNWEVSLARATAVVRFLQEEVGLEPERLMAVGYGPYHPIASNKTEEGRQKNRRVEIFLGPAM